MEGDLHGGPRGFGIEDLVTGAQLHEEVLVLVQDLRERVDHGSGETGADQELGGVAHGLDVVRHARVGSAGHPGQAGLQGHGAVGLGAVFDDLVRERHQDGRPAHGHLGDDGGGEAHAGEGVVHVAVLVQAGHVPVGGLDDGAAVLLDGVVGNPVVGEHEGGHHEFRGAGHGSGDLDPLALLDLVHELIQGGDPRILGGQEVVVVHGQGAREGRQVFVCLVVDGCGPVEGGLVHIPYSPGDVGVSVVQGDRVGHAAARDHLDRDLGFLFVDQAGESAGDGVPAAAHAAGHPGVGTRLELVCPRGGRVLGAVGEGHTDGKR